MADYIVGGVIVLIIVGAAWYVIKAKKSGRKCIGCPAAGGCSKCGCSCGEDQEKT
jgi:hypothetical protein